MNKIHKMGLKPDIRNKHSHGGFETIGIWMFLYLKKQGTRQTYWIIKTHVYINILDLWVRVKCVKNVL